MFQVQKKKTKRKEIEGQPTINKSKSHSNTSLLGLLLGLLISWGMWLWIKQWMNPRENLQNLREQRMPTVNNITCGLRRLVGSIKLWNSRLHELVIRYLELMVLECAQRSMILYTLFDDESDFRKITLRRMERLVKEQMGDHGFPICENEYIDGQLMDVLAFWRSLKELLYGMVIEGCEELTLDRLRKLSRTTSKNDLSLVTRAQMVF